MMQENEKGVCDKMTSDVEITFIANCGFLIVSGDTKILTDAPYRNYPLDDGYLFSDESMELMENGEPPFDDVDLVLISHAHGGHFDAEAVGKHLESNPHGMFVSTHPAAKELKIASPNLERIHERVIAVYRDCSE